MKITIVGDVNLGGSLSDNFEQYQDNCVSKNVINILKQDSDLIICNLESPLAKLEPPNRLPPDKPLSEAASKTIKVLSDCGFNLVSLANNHILDFGHTSMQKTLKILKENSICYAGAGNNYKLANEPCSITTSKNQKILFFSYALPETWFRDKPNVDRDYSSWRAKKTSAGIAFFDIDTFKQTMKSINISDVFVIVAIHWNGYSRYPSPKLIKLSKMIIDSGVSLIIGSHPHVVQGVMRYKKGLIIYSLGNFLFPSHYNKYDEKGNYEGRFLKWKKESRRSVIMKLNYSRDKEIHYQFIPVYQLAAKPMVVIDKNPKNKVSEINKLSLLYSSKSYASLHWQLRLKEKSNFGIVVKISIQQLMNSILKKFLEYTVVRL